MNVCIIIPSLYGGGAERVAADLSIYFTNNDYKVFIFTDLLYKCEYLYNGELVHFSFGLDNNMSNNPIITKIDELVNLKIKYQIDVAISFMQLANLYNIMSKQKEKIILTTHSFNSLYAKTENDIHWSEYTFRYLYQFADAITFPSEYCRKDWIEHYGDKNNITKTMYNPVHHMQTVEEEKKENIILAIGRMHPIKRQWHIIRTFKKIKEECQDSKLIILGEGPLKKELVELIDEYKLTDSVILPGNVNNVHEYLTKAKVVVMTSICEAMPCSVLEALSAGVPVVSCDSPGGIREEIGVSAEIDITEQAILGECGIITPYIKEYYPKELTKEEIIFSQQVVRLLKNENLRLELSEKAKRRTEDFSIDKIGEKWINELIENDAYHEFDSATFIGIKDKIIEMSNEKASPNLMMYRDYYRILENWMILHENGKRVNNYFINQNMKNIIIYGLGKMANHLIHDLEDSEIEIVCGIDKNAINKYDKFPILQLSSELPDADCIVVTAAYDFEKIFCELERITSIPIISLAEIVSLL